MIGAPEGEERRGAEKNGDRKLPQPGKETIQIQEAKEVPSKMNTINQTSKKATIKTES